MIPNFPEFKNIEWNDRSDVEQFTNQFPPYSDFNFTSLWSWNTREKMKLSQLHGNLILLFYDYVSETPFLSFIGSNQISDTALALLEYSKLHFQIDYLKLIPELVAVGLESSIFKILPDEDSNDYIISVEYLSALDTLPKSANKAAYLCQKNLRLYPHHSIRDCIVSEIVKEEYITHFKDWARNKNLDHVDLNEYLAFERFIYNEGNVTRIISLYDDDIMTGFATYEILSNVYAICHFAKANKEYKGIYDCLYFAVGKILQKQNIRYWNFEQDLGIPGLRQAKRKYKPEFFLRKYIIQKHG